MEREPRPGIYSVIDVGTNSVKLQVARMTPAGVLDTVAFRQATTRLGSGLTHGGKLDPRRIEDTANVVDRFARVARSHGSSAYVVGTHAFRVASNAERACRIIESVSGLPVHVLTRREEATFAYVSARASLVSPRGSVILADFGGGSVDFVHAVSGEIKMTKSLSLGALHLTEKYIRTDPVDVADYDRLQTHVERSLVRSLANHLAAVHSPPQLVASGGSATTILKMLPEQVTRVSLGSLKHLRDMLLPMSLSERHKVPGLPRDRADIILAGITVAICLMKLARKRNMSVNPGGIREGILLTRADG